MRKSDRNTDPSATKDAWRRFSAYLGISACLNLSVWVLLLFPSYLTDIGWGAQRVGWAISIYFLTNLLAQLLFGILVQKWGLRRVALIGSAAGGLGGALYLAGLFWPTAFWPARVLHGAGGGLVLVAAFTQLLRSEPGHLRGKAIGYFGIPGFLMIGLGPSLADWISRSHGHLMIFLIAFLCFVPLVLGYALGRDRQEPAVASVPQRLGWKLTLRQNGLVRVLLLAVLFGFSFSCWMTFLAPAMAHLAGAIAVFGFTYAGGAVVSRLTLTGQFANSASRWLAVGALVVYGAITIALPGAQSLPQLGILTFFAGVIHGTYYPALSVVAAERFHPQWQGHGLALYAAAQSLGLFLGPPAWGVVTDFGGVSSAFLLAGAILTVGTAGFLVRELLLDRVDPSRRRSKSAEYAN